MDHICTYCALVGTFKVCAKCKNTHYCSKKCQIADWSEHKLECRRKYSPIMHFVEWEQNFKRMARL